MNSKQIERRNVKNDPQFSKPYIDVDEWRIGKQVRYHYIHGGFEGTDTRFSFFFPEKEDYKGRFFQFMAPVQGHEDAAIHRQHGVEDKIAFAITHGAYFIETNMGVNQPFVQIDDNTLIERASAACAEYSRVVARELFGEHRPYGYLYGGSGGGYKTMICFENNDAWDGAVPYVIGTPMSIPSAFTVRAHALRILRNKIEQIADAADVGSELDIYDGLNEEEAAALKEFTNMGFPVNCWTLHNFIDDGSLPVLTPAVDRMDPGYYQDFWEIPGYPGADPEGSAARDRICYETVIAEIHLPDKKDKDDRENTSGVDEAWQAVRGDALFNGRPWVRFAQMPEGDDPYVHNTTMKILSGEAVGLVVPLDAMKEGKISIGPGFGIADMAERLALVKPGDQVKLDNSDYLALQSYHRHITPESGYPAWDQFRDEQGKPLYPQRPYILSYGLATSGCSKNQSGLFEGKMIVVASLMDESAFPWMADWYRQLVQEQMAGNEEDYFRLWYTNRAIHGDLESMPERLKIVSYLGVLHQALLDVSDWVERGIAPAKTTKYSVEDCQVIVPSGADERLGIQPSVELLANGGKCARVKVGEAVNLSAVLKAPIDASRLVGAAWSFEGEEDFANEAKLLELNEEETGARVEATHIYTQPGTYFAVLRVQASRDGKADDIFTQLFDLDRVRVIVE
jgi:hypothetical protein